MVLHHCNQGSDSLVKQPDIAATGTIILEEEQQGGSGRGGGTYTMISNDSIVCYWLYVWV